MHSYKFYLEHIWWTARNYKGNMLSSKYCDYIFKWYTRICVR